MKKCSWSWETLQKKGSITIEDVEAHKKVCQICQEIDRKTLKGVDYSYPLLRGWKEPKCPFCFSEVPKPGIWEHKETATEDIEDESGSIYAKKGEEYIAASGYKREACPGCGARYSYNPVSEESEEIPDAVADLLGKEEHEIIDEDLTKVGIDVYVYHNYSYESHAFNDYLSSIYDSIEDNGPNLLGHLWFVRKRKDGEEPVRQPLSEGSMRYVIREAVELLEKTRSAFKSKLIAEAREKLERLL